MGEDTRVGLLDHHAVSQELSFFSWVGQKGHLVPECPGLMLVLALGPLGRRGSREVSAARLLRVVVGLSGPLERSAGLWVVLRSILLRTDG